MRRFKRQFEGRRDVEKKKGMLIYEKEVLTMKEKDTLVEIYRVKEMQKIEVLRRV